MFMVDLGKAIQVIGSNGYTRKLSLDDCVIMYDNNSKIPIFPIIYQYATRLALCQRTIDINIWQQKTTRIWKVPNELLPSVRDAMSKIDSFQEALVQYDGIDFNEITSILAEAPFISDKVAEQKDKLWNEFLRFVGVANISYQKKERNISDEINAMMGGTIVSRFDRYKPRLKAIEEINEKFSEYLPNGQLELEYYDGLPNSKEQDEPEGEVVTDDASYI